MPGLLRRIGRRVARALVRACAAAATPLPGAGHLLALATIAELPLEAAAARLAPARPVAGRCGGDRYGGYLGLFGPA